MQMIKKYWAYLLLLFSVLFFVYQKVIKESESLQVKAFNTHKGWGYDIFKDNKLYIHQDVIPAVEGRKSFASKDEAVRIGELVISKIKQGKGGGLPQITVQEIDSLKITR
jgi:predicted glutamine amidotransferase